MKALALRQFLSSCQASQLKMHRLHPSETIGILGRPGFQKLLQHLFLPELGQQDELPYVVPFCGESFILCNQLVVVLKAVVGTESQGVVVPLGLVL